MSAPTPAECRQLRQCLIEAAAPMLFGADIVAALFGLHHAQLKRRLRDGDLYDLKASRAAVLTLGRQVRGALQGHKFDTGQSILSGKVL